MIMKYNESNFRAFYHRFYALRLSEEKRPLIDKFPGASKANAMIVYGYIDHEAGMTLEVLAGANLKEGSINYYKPSNTRRSIIRIKEVENDELFYLDDSDGKLADFYAEKISVVEEYKASEDIEKTRCMEFLDASRDTCCVDDVLVYLFVDGKKTEGCWVRIEGLGDHHFIGTLLNEPNQDMGCHAGDLIIFYVTKNEDGNYICYSSAELVDDVPEDYMGDEISLDEEDVVENLTEEDLEDGTLLEEMISNFNENQTEQNLFNLLRVLRDSWVWVPCTAVMSDNDQQRMLKMINSLDGDYGALEGQDFVALDETRMIPDILKNGEEFFFPVFSNEEAMGEYGNDFSKVARPMLEVIPLARNNEQKLFGIVINAFTEPFVLPENLWESLENMESQLS
ncbi:SseB family protein [Coprobacillus sp. AF09-1A]|nr:SseB family protein [Coprobacillus sp. AF09-1A]